MLEAAITVMIRAKRTNEATVSERKCSWEIKVNYYSGKGVARKLLSSSGYECKSSALWHAPYFRHAAEMLSRGKYPSWWENKVNLEERNLPVYMNCCCIYGQDAFNIAESYSLKALKRKNVMINRVEILEFQAIFPLRRDS